MGNDPLGEASGRGARSRAVATALQAEIRLGQWPVGARLPAEPELARRFDVAINTIRRAVSQLVEKGVLSRRQGSGTYVMSIAEENDDGRGPADEKPRRLIGAVLPTAAYYHPDLVGGLEAACSGRGGEVMVAYADYSPERELVRSRELAAAGAMGLVLTPSIHRIDDIDGYLRDIDELGLPYVFVERRPPDRFATRISYVRADWFAAGLAAVQHLVSVGRRRLAFIGRHGRTTSPDISAGFLRGLSELDLPVLEPAIALRDSWTRDELREFARTCVAESVDGIFCLDDRLGVELLPALRQSSVSVPHDISVVAYDNNVAELAEVPLTTLAPAKRIVGSTAVDILFRSFDGEAASPVFHLDIVPTLITRLSCGALDMTDGQGANLTTSDESRVFQISG